MTLFEEIKTHTGKRRVYDIIFFAFLSSFIAAIENMFPRPIPYFRIGFSFIIILMVLDSFNFKELLLMIAIKNISVAIVFAYILTPPFYLGITGGIMSVIVMKLMRNFRNIFSLLGVSIAGALVSNLSQAILSQYLFNLPDIKFLILPVLIISLITGSIIGIFTIIFNRE
ncbi:Gx transporter family protein [Brachyspira pilosicoli]|uniref:Integral membrane protein n=1 Tax=Brachyspira pilosicoli P43/6/78 TaxID=1042417 RepID=A0A3B6VUN8_BRAPL|nr:Gx transporter family protein [Brachyspira pilosicoli]AGA67502.1 Integral membrane protein [Brachyspira pilosicoli P43/6/78]WIH83508.1 Gx transporter family protein [Brachyspira pilosicoli]SUW09531.1 Integral membrane protein [Brachyspira pilosicoli]